MPARLPEHKRAAIRDAILARDGRSRAQIARDCASTPRTVQRIANEAGVINPWDTSGTRAATQSAADRRRAARSQLADDLLDDAQWLRQLMRAAADWRKTVVGPEGPERVRADDVEIAAGIRNYLTSIGIALDKTLAVDKHDAGDENADTVATLAAFAGMLRDHASNAADGPNDEQEPEQ